MTKHFVSSGYDLANIFSSDFECHIPAYQRPYAWTTDQASDLFDDLYSFYEREENKEQVYFLGSVVLIKEEAKPFSEVIDGQQRLTTLTILFAVLASKLSGEDKVMVSKYIVEPGNKFEQIEAKPRLTLRSRDENFFKEYVQEFKFDELFGLNEANLSEPQKNIQANAKYFMEHIDYHFADNAKINEFIIFLLNRCFLIVVSTPNRESAFRVFSVMNNRGLNLQLTDIVKADMIGKMQGDDEQDSYSQQWEELEIKLGRDVFSDLFSFIRMIYAKEKPQKSIIDEFKTHVLKSKEIDNNPKKLLNDILEPYTDALNIIKNENYKATENAKEVNFYLQWLNKIDNSDWIPVAMLFWKNNSNNPSDMLWFFTKLERLSAYLHICSKTVNQRIKRYNEVIAALEGCSFSQNQIQEIELKSQEVKEMRKVLDGDIYSLNARRRNYVVLRLDSFISDKGAIYDPKVLTIEHVLPQTVNQSSQWEKMWPDEEKRDEWLHRISNLVPLNKRRNSKASNYDFTKKKEAYFSGTENGNSYQLTMQVLQAKEWTEEFLKKRQKTLLNVFYKGWDLSGKN